MGEVVEEGEIVEEGVVGVKVVEVEVFGVVGGFLLLLHLFERGRQRPYRIQIGLGARGDFICRAWGEVVGVGVVVVGE